MVSSLLLDTNIWLDFYLPPRPGYEAAGELVSFATRHEITLYYAAHSVADLFYIMEAQARRGAEDLRAGTAEQRAHVAKAMSYDAIRNLSQIATAVGVDQSDVWLAQKYYRVHPDLEDDLIMAAATRAKADYLISNDRQLLQHAVVPALSPTDFLRLDGNNESATGE